MIRRGECQYIEDNSYYRTISEETSALSALTAFKRELDRRKYELTDYELINDLFIKIMERKGVRI